MPENFSIFDYDLADLLGGDFDLSGTPVDLGFVPTYEISPGTDNYYTLTGGIEQYKERLQEGADYAKIDDVDKVDDFYDQSFQSNLSAIQVDPETYLRETASPTYLANWQGRPEQQAAEDVYGSIAITMVMMYKRMPLIKLSKTLVETTESILALLKKKYQSFNQSLSLSLLSK